MRCAIPEHVASQMTASPLLDESLVQSAMLQAKALNVPLSFHEEDPFFIEKSGTNRTGSCRRGRCARRT